MNINSIKKHKDELLVRFAKYDIISVNETNLKNEHKFSLPGYNIFRNDRDGKGGGVLLAVKLNIKCRELLNKTANQNEMIAVQVETKRFGSILVSSVYIPPTAKMNLNIFREMYSINNNCIILGDLNVNK